MRPIHYVAHVDIGAKRMKMSDVHMVRRMSNRSSARRIEIIATMGVSPTVLTKLVCALVHKWQSVSGMI